LTIFECQASRPSRPVVLRSPVRKPARLAPRLLSVPSSSMTPCSGLQLFFSNQTKLFDFELCGHQIWLAFTNLCFRTAKLCLPIIVSDNMFASMKNLARGMQAYFS